MENNELPKIPEWVNERMRTFNIGESIKYECLANIDTRIHDGNICLGESRAKETAKNIRLRQKIDLYVDRKCNQESGGKYYVTIMRINTPQYSDIPDRVKALSIGESFSYKCTGNKDGKWEDGDVRFDKHLNRMVHKNQKTNPISKLPIDVCSNLNKIKWNIKNWKNSKGWSHLSIDRICVENEDGEFYTTITRLEDIPESLQNVKVSDKEKLSKLRVYASKKAGRRGKETVKNRSSRPGYKIQKKLRAEVLHRDNLTCHYCGKHESQLKFELQADHVIPWRFLRENNIFKNGYLKHEYFNLVASCRACNREKSDTIYKNHCNFCSASYNYYKNIIGEDNLTPFVREYSDLEGSA